MPFELDLVGLGSGGLLQCSLASLMVMRLAIRRREDTLGSLAEDSGRLRFLEDILCDFFDGISLGQRVVHLQLGDRGREDLSLLATCDILLVQLSATVVLLECLEEAWLQDAALLEELLDEGAFVFSLSRLPILPGCLRFLASLLVRRRGQTLREHQVLKSSEPIRLAQIPRQLLTVALALLVAAKDARVLVQVAQVEPNWAQWRLGLHIIASTEHLELVLSHRVTLLIIQEVGLAVLVSLEGTAESR